MYFLFKTDYIIKCFSVHFPYTVIYIKNVPQILIRKKILFTKNLNIFIDLSSLPENVL